MMMALLWEEVMLALAMALEGIWFLNRGSWI